MNKLYRYMQNYLMYGFGFVVVLLLWSVGSAYFYPHSLIEESNLVIKVLHELLSYNLMLWFVTFVIYMAMLVMVPRVREKTLSRLANLQERDEREEYITGKAARASYIATLSLTLFFLFFSLINVNVSNINQTDTHKPQHSFGVGIGYSFFKQAEVNQPNNAQITSIFDTKQFSLSSSTIILILLGWQLVTFNLVARAERAKDL